MSESREVLGQQLVALARATVESRLAGRLLAPPPELIEAFPEEAGVFVTIRRDTGQLRGCVGTQRPTCVNVPEEIVRVAPLAAFSDPRFRPIRAEELDDLRFEVSILTPTEPVKDASQLDAARYGITMEDDHGRRALLLPAIPGIDTVDRQLHEIRLKAGIPAGVPVHIERFEVEKFSEPD